MVKVNYIGQYTKMLKALSTTEEMTYLVEEKVTLFRNNPDDTRLKNHALTRRMEGKWAFSITDDIRIVYEWIGTGTVRFLAIGSHVQVYPK